jgi:hypothetical protein
MNIYFQFLEYVRSKVYDQGIMTELHHEPPHYTKKSSDDSPLNVRASLNDHALLHYYRWLIYGQVEDKIAWMWRMGQTEEARLEMNRKRIEVCKRDKIGFWDSEVQRELGRRGATASHKVQRSTGVGRWNSETQREIALKGNTPEVKEKKAEGGRKGGTNSVETRREMGVGVFNRESRIKGNRMVNLSRWGYVVGGERIKWDTELRKNLSETFKDYVLEFGFPPKATG